MAQLVTVHLLVNTDSDTEQADLLSGLLSEIGMYDTEHGPSTLIDWGYPVKGKTAEGFSRYDYGKPIEIPDDYIEGDFYKYLTD